MENLVPIKFFGKRENDSSRTEPGGSSDLPKWVLQGEELIKKSEYVKSFLEELEEKMEKRDDKAIPLTITTKLTEKAKAKSHRSEIANIFENRLSKNNLIGMIGEDEIIIKVESINSLRIISEKTGDYNKNAYGLSCIDELKLFTPIIRKDPNEEKYKIKLINYKNYNLNTSIIKKFELYCNKQGIQINRKNYSDELLIFKSNKMSTDMINKIENLPYVYSVEPMPKYKFEAPKSEISTAEDIILPKENKNYVTVGILDSGIERINQLEPWIEGNRISPYPDSVIDTTHGTFVAGVILYGDILEGKNYTGLEGCKIFDGNVFPDLTKETITEDELIDNIRDIIDAKYNEIKIWNLSGGAVEEIDNDEFSDFAIALDDIQDQYGVIICKSTGNCTNFSKNSPKSRIAKSADSVRALTVGSLAHKKDINDLADVDYPSPFTRIGRGPSYIIKPEVVHYGGNAGVDSKGNMTVTGVKSFDKYGKVSSLAGTSFSTPRITSILAALSNEIDEEFDPLLLKALAIHSANYSSNLRMQQSDKLIQMGYGKPKNAKEILYNDNNEITLIMRDTLEKGKFIDILDFPFPDTLLKNGYYTGQVSATLVYNPILDGTQASEYCQSNIDIKFGSYDEKTQRDVSKNNIFNPVGRKNSQNVLCDSLYSKKLIKNPQTDFALSERMLISYGDKYYPVKKYAVDLSEMTQSNKDKWLCGNKKWFLKINGSYRHNIERIYQQNSQTLSQEFCLIISIKDPSKTTNVYDDVTQLLEHHNFWHNNIRLSQNVSIDINN